MVLTVAVLTVSAFAT